MWVAELPDFERLYAVPPVEPDWDTATDAECAAVPLLTPREAVAIWSVADELAGEWSEGDIDELAQLLPPAVQLLATEAFVRRLAQCFVDIKARVAAGVTSELDIARCTGDEWAVHRAIEAAADWLTQLGVLGSNDESAVSTDDLGAELARRAPSTWLDADNAEAFVRDVPERLLQDADVEWLYDLPATVFEQAHPELDAMGFANLHPSQWFLPFGNVDDPDM